MKITERDIEQYCLQTLEKWEKPWETIECGLCLFAKRVAGVARAEHNYAVKYCTFCPTRQVFHSDCQPILRNADTDAEIVTLLMDYGPDLIQAMIDIAMEYDFYEEAHLRLLDCLLA